MSEQWGGPGWWIGGDGKWYPPQEPVRDSQRQSRYGAADLSSTGVHGTSGLQRQMAPQRPPIEQRDDADVRLLWESDRPTGAQSDDDPAELVDDDERGAFEEAVSEVHDAPDDEAATEETVSSGSEPEEAVADGWPKIDLRDEIDAKRELARQQTAWDSVARTKARSASSTTSASAPKAENAPITFDLRAPEDRESSEATDADLAGTPGEAAAQDGQRVAPDLEKPPEPRVSPASFSDARRVALPALQTSEEVPYVEYSDDRYRRRTGPILLALATILAVLCGLLGALWLRERSASSELRSELVDASAVIREGGGDSTVLANTSEADLVEEIQDLQAENDELAQQLANMSALVLELPPGRVSEIEAPFAPTFADEQDGRLVAVDAAGRYAIWGDGSNGEVTETGELGSTPTALFISRNRAWISTEAAGVGVLTLANEADPTFVDYAPARFLAEEERGYWTYDELLQLVVRINKADGVVTNSVSVPSPVVDMTIGAGAVWALGEDGLVYRINTADFTVQAISLGEAIVSVTAGPDTLWALSAADGALRRVDPVSGEVLVTVPVGRDPVDATFAGNSVWVALRAGESLVEVDTRTSAVVSRTTLAGPPAALHQGDAGVFVTLDGEQTLTLVSSAVSGDDAG